MGDGTAVAPRRSLVDPQASIATALVPGTTRKESDGNNLPVLAVDGSRGMHIMQQGAHAHLWV